MKQIFKNKNLQIFSIILSGLVLSGFILNHTLAGARYAQEDNQMTTIESSSQFKDGKFHNKETWNEGEAFSTMWDFFFSKNQRTPEDSLPRQQVDLSFFKQTSDNHLNSTWLGHSSLMINIDGYKILTDPIFEKRVSVFGPSRFNGELPVDVDNIDSVDVVVISHNHYDHLNKSSIQSLTAKTGLFIVPLAVGAQLIKWDVPADKIIEMDWWQEYRVTENLMIAATPSQHFSGRGLTDRNETLWASFVIQGPNHKIYFSGDGGYFEGFKLIGETYGPFDMTFMECGAYNKAWEPIHMLPEQTVQAHIDLRGNVLHPIHWGTFNLSLHSWFEPMERFTRAADSLGVVSTTPIVGGTTVFDTDLASTKWWESVPKMEIKDEEADSEMELQPAQ